MLAAEDVERYARDGYLVVRDALDDAEIERFATAFRRHPPLHGPLPGTYPAPAATRWPRAAWPIRTSVSWPAIR